MLATLTILFCLTGAPESDFCSRTADPTMCRIERDATADETLPPLACFVPCDTDTRCEEQASRCATI